MNKKAARYGDRVHAEKELTAGGKLIYLIVAIGIVAALAYVWF